MSLLRALAENHALRPLDIHSAEMLERLHGAPCPTLLFSAAFASLATGQGHTCLPLARLIEHLGAHLPEAPSDCAALRAELLATGMVGQPGDHAPLILDQDQLYLTRFHRYEQAVTRWLHTKALEQTIPPDLALPRALLDELFPRKPGDAPIDRQKIAAALALMKPFLVIAGGPGTGKTYTVARILALLRSCPSLWPDETQAPRIALTAPTGKAALRLRESILQAQAGLPDELARMPEELEKAQTLHRLLGFGSGAGGGFFFHAGNPLVLDALILDEASMLDLPLMAALLDALPLHCRLILLGDPDQLASVEAGNLLGDICGAVPPLWSDETRARLGEIGCQLDDDLSGGIASGNNTASILDDSLVFLQENRRFDKKSAIAELAEALRQADSSHVEAIMRRKTDELRIETDSAARGQAILDCFLPLMNADNTRNALEALGRRRILCALREGPDGVEGINRLAESMLRRLGQIPPDSALYRGMPIMILRNDYLLGLFNGDTGILWPDENGDLLAWFPKENGVPHGFAPARLPLWQRSFALTAHKAQGSEFAHVFLILPQEDSPVLSRELLYTAITRAKEGVSICGPAQDILPRLARRHVQRHSGLAARLRADISA